MASGVISPFSTWIPAAPILTSFPLSLIIILLISNPAPHPTAKHAATIATILNTFLIVSIFRFVKVIKKR